MRYPRNEKEWIHIYERKLVKQTKDLVDLSLFTWSLDLGEKPYELDGLIVEPIPVMNYSKIQELYDKKFGFGAALLDTINDILKVLGTTVKLNRLHRKKPIDIILAASFSMSGFYPVLFANLKGIPLVTQSFGYDVSVRKEINYGLRLKSDKFRWLSTLALRYVDLILPNSRGLAEDTVLNRYRDKIRIVYHGVDLEEFNRKTVTGKSVNKGKKGKRLVVLNVGGLLKVKGWNYIVETAARLKGYDIEFKLVGAGDDIKEFEAMVEKMGLNNVEYLGSITHRELKQSYNNADIFFLPSLSEGLPNSMLEAAAMELALIGSGEGGARDIIVEGENGYYIREPDPDKFAEKILYLYEHPKPLKKMKRAARERMEKDFNWEDIALDFVKVLKEFKGSRG